VLSASLPLVIESFLDVDVRFPGEASGDSSGDMDVTSFDRDAEGIRHRDNDGRRQSRLGHSARINSPQYPATRSAPAAPNSC
jgi:hypothetical protein